MELSMAVVDCVRISTSVCISFMHFHFLVRGGTSSKSDELHRIERCIRIVVIHFGSGSFGVDVDEAGDDGVVRVSLEAIRLSPGHIAFPHSSLLAESFVPLRPSAAYSPAIPRVGWKSWVLLNCRLPGLIR